MSTKTLTLALFATAAFAEPFPQQAGQHGRHHRSCYRNGRFDSRRCRGTGTGFTILPTGIGSSSNGTIVSPTSVSNSTSVNVTSVAIAASTAAASYTLITRPFPGHGHNTGRSSAAGSRTTTSQVVVTTSKAPVPVTSSSTSSSTTIAPVPTSSAAPAPSTPASGNTAKKGLSFTNTDVLPAWNQTDIGWTYNWWTDRGSVPESMDYYPMMWCPTKDSVSAWTTAANTAISQGSTRILGFNEPDRPDQCNLPDVNDAITGHQNYMNQFKGRVKVGSPAVSNSGAPGGLTYLESFLQGCANNCTVDFLNVHWYGTAASDFESHVTDAITLATKYNVPEVFVTEFAPTGGDATSDAAFVKQVVPWLEQNDKVGGYAYFMASDGSLMSGTDISPVLGEAYATTT